MELGVREPPLMQVRQDRLGCSVSVTEAEWDHSPTIASWILSWLGQTFQPVPLVAHYALYVMKCPRAAPTCGGSTSVCLCETLSIIIRVAKYDGMREIVAMHTCESVPRFESLPSRFI